MPSKPVTKDSQGIDSFGSKQEKCKMLDVKLIQDILSLIRYINIYQHTWGIKISKISYKRAIKNAEIQARLWLYENDKENTWMLSIKHQVSSASLYRLLSQAIGQSTCRSNFRSNFQKSNRNTVPKIKIFYVSICFIYYKSVSSSF